MFLEHIHKLSTQAFLIASFVSEAIRSKLFEKNFQQRRYCVHFCVLLLSANIRAKKFVDRRQFFLALVANETNLLRELS